MYAPGFQKFDIFFCMCYREWQGLSFMYAPGFQKFDILFCMYIIRILFSMWASAASFLSHDFSEGIYENGPKDALPNVHIYLMATERLVFVQQLELVGTSHQTLDQTYIQMDVHY